MEMFLEATPLLFARALSKAIRKLPRRLPIVTTRQWDCPSLDAWSLCINGMGEDRHEL